MRKTLTMMAIALPMAASLAMPAQAQDYSLDPAYGSVTLDSGFSPDPYTVNLQSGGPVDVGSRLGGDCRGYVANAPDFRLNYVAGDVFSLTVSVSANADTTLVINNPSGDFVCNDDGGEGLNPAYTFANPQSGQYDIWVGTYGSDELEDATLYISELDDQTAGNTVSSSASSSGSGPDWSLDPNYGTVELSSGFSPDPHSIDLLSGGSYDASELGSGCNGYIASAPDYRVNYDAGDVFPLIISVNSENDTTLVINGPNGNWHCDDDGAGYPNPRVRFDNPVSGQYDIWVGTYGDSSLENATLSISELE